MADATLVNVPVQRNSKDENQQVKTSEIPAAWSESNRRQKDTVARHNKKRKKSFFGHKNRANVDAQHKIIGDYEVTAASVHDSQVFDELLSPADSNPNVYADSAYRSKATEETLAQGDYNSHVHQRAYRNTPLTDEQKEANRVRSKTRVRVEHVFGSQLQLAGDLIIRTVGIVRAKTKIGLRNLSYNLNRYGLLNSKAGMP